MRLRGTYLNAIKALYVTPIVNITLNGENNPIKVRNEIGLSTIPVYFNIVPRAQAKEIRHRRELKGYK